MFYKISKYLYDKYIITIIYHSCRNDGRSDELLNSQALPVEDSGKKIRLLRTSQWYHKESQSGLERRSLGPLTGMA